jgi:NhaP-type Na+/H+ or K+/H+ antiporter
MADLSFETLVVLVLITIFIVFSTYLPKWSRKHRWISCIHESGIAICLGMLIGGVSALITGETTSKFEDQIFFKFMLPFLIFGLGYNMKRRRFFRNIGTILRNGVLGTIINFIVLSTIAWVFCNSVSLDEELDKITDITLKDSLTLGAVLTSTEMVVTLSILKESQTPKLRSMMFGEGIVNIAVSILLVNAISIVDFQKFTALGFFELFGYFILSLFVSVLIGVVFGFISAYMTKEVSQIKGIPSKEVALQFYLAWTAYILAEMAKGSGVIAILICAIISGHYAYYNMEGESRIVVTDTFHLIGEGTRGLIFSYLGLTCFSYATGDIYYSFVVIMLASTILVRLISVFGIAYIYSSINKRSIFDPKMLSVIWIGGLFRGTIGFALIISADVDHKEILEVTVLYLVIFSMIVDGPLLYLWVLLVKPEEEVIHHESIIEAVEDGDFRHSYFGGGRANLLRTITVGGTSKKRNWLHKKWRDLDIKYFKPLFINQKSLEEQKQLKEALEKGNIRNVSENPSQKGIEID